VRPFRDQLWDMRPLPCLVCRGPRLLRPGSPPLTAQRRRAAFVLDGRRRK